MNALRTLIALALVFCASGFQIAVRSSAMGQFKLFSAATEDDIFAAEAKALEATKKFGATSPEARLAWEAVEEMNAAARPANAMKKNLDVECDVSDGGEVCKEFNMHMERLAELTAEGSATAAASLANKNKELFAENRLIMKELGELKLGLVPTARVELQSATVEDAIFKAEAAALEATKKYGATSPEARLAWETVEEMNASARPANAMLKNLDVECDLSNGGEECKEFNMNMEKLAELTKGGSVEAAVSLAMKNNELYAENRLLQKQIDELK
uniref:Uncharacterized protein n=1 Tax=Heterosigma akashiwo TaxID=2829 RepID=A0A6V2QHI9_HETAK